MIKLYKSQNVHIYCPASQEWQWRHGIRDLESIDTRDLSIRISLSGVYKLIFYLTIVNKHNVTVTLGWQDSNWC